MKEYNHNRYHTTKHSTQFDEILGQARVDKIEHLNKFTEEQWDVSTSYKKDKELISKLSFMLCESMAK